MTDREAYAPNNSSVSSIHKTLSIYGCKYLTEWLSSISLHHSNDWLQSSEVEKDEQEFQTTVRKTLSLILDMHMHFFFTYNKTTKMKDWAELDSLFCEPLPLNSGKTRG